MAFLVAGTLQAAAQVVDSQDSLGRKGKYSLQGPRAALLLSSPGVPARIPQLLEDAFRALGFHSCRRREAKAQAFLGELAGFREQLDAQGGPVGCALVAVVAPAGQLQQPQSLAWELSYSTALRGCPKVLLLLSSTPGAPLQPGAFPSILAELCGLTPQLPLLRLLTEVFLRVTEASPGATSCPVLRSSLRGSLCLQEVEPWKPEPEGLGVRYELAGARAALIVAVVRGRPGAWCDVEALRDLCQALGFQTTVRTDATAQAFQEELARFREQLDSGRGTVSCALVALMAHGGPGGQLHGADGQAVQHEVLVRELSRCWALRGRPKIFLLQACRGGHRDAGVGRPALSWFWRWLQAPPVTPSHADILQVYASAQGMSSGDPAPGSYEQADILTAYAAAEGHVAYRDESGSDFIQTLVEVIRAEPQRELLELLTEVCWEPAAGPGAPHPSPGVLAISSWPGCEGEVSPQWSSHRSTGGCASWKCWDLTATSPARPAWRSAARCAAGSTCSPERPLPARAFVDSPPRPPWPPSVNRTTSVQRAVNGGGRWPHARGRPLSPGRSQDVPQCTGREPTTSRDEGPGAALDEGRPGQGLLGVHVTFQYSKGSLPSRRRPEPRVGQRTADPGLTGRAGQRRRSRNRTRGHPPAPCRPRPRPYQPEGRGYALLGACASWTARKRFNKLYGKHGAIVPRGAAWPNG